MDMVAALYAVYNDVRRAAAPGATGSLPTSANGGVAGVGAESSERSPQCCIVWGLPAVDPSHPQEVFQQAASLLPPVSSGQKRQVEMMSEQRNINRNEHLDRRH